MDGLVLGVGGVGVLCAVAGLKVWGGVEVGWVTRDMATTAEAHPMTGVLSGLGLVLWWVTAGVCWFAGGVLRAMGGERGRVWYLVNSGLLTAWLGLDDWLMIHEALAKRWLGVNEEIVYGVIAGVAVVHVLVFRRVIAQTRWGLLGVGLFCLAVSMGVDELLSEWSVRTGDWWYLLEDGSKWLGILCWCLYFVKTSWGFVVRASDTRVERALRG